MKQWKIQIEPKCSSGNELFVTHQGKVRPCSWVNELSDEKKFFDENENWDLNNTTLEEITNVQLKEFVDSIKKNPYNGLKVCFYECTNKCSS